MYQFCCRFTPAVALPHLLVESPAGQGGGSHADSSGCEGGGVPGDGVLVGGHAGHLEDPLNAGAVDSPALLEVNEDEVVGGSSTDELVAHLHELVGELGRVGEDLLLVIDEGGLLGLLEAGGESGDCVVVGSSLEAGEDSEVELVLNVVHDLLALLVDAADALTVEDHGPARATEGLVGGGGDNVGKVKGGGDDLCRDEAGNVGHIGEDPSSNGVGNLADPAGRRKGC